MSVSNVSWGLPVMDRLDKTHRASRVALPSSILDQESGDASAVPIRRFRLMASRYLGMVGFVAGGIVVITAASLLALSVH